MADFGIFGVEDWISLGKNNGAGNLLGIQPWVSLDDYFSQAAFYRRLQFYLEAALEKGWINPRTIAVFPEYIGAWLVATGEGKGVFNAGTLQDAMKALALAHPAPLAGHLLTSREKDRIAASLFRVKAHSMAAIYNDAFSNLAGEYNLTVVAGSILLPEPRVANGRVEAGRGPLRNVSAVFGPNGQAYPDLARKCFPIQDELPFLGPADPQNLPVYETPAGRLGVLVCADSWFPQAYTPLQSQDVQILAVPSYINKSGAWDTPWGGYSGWPAPEDVDPADINQLTEGQAWRKYAMAGRIPASGAGCGVNVFLQGALWDLGSDGRSVIVKNGDVKETSTGRGGLLNLWL